MEWFSRGVPLFCPPEGASAGRLRPMSLFNVYTWPIVRLTPRVASRRAAAARHLMAWNLTARWAQALHCKCQHMIHKSTDVGCWCSKVKKMRGARSCEGEFTYLISISTFCYDLGDVFGMMQYKSVRTVFLKMISKIRSWLQHYINTTTMYSF